MAAIFMPLFCEAVSGFLSGFNPLPYSNTSNALNRCGGCLVAFCGYSWRLLLCRSGGKLPFFGCGGLSSGGKGQKIGKKWCKKPLFNMTLKFTKPSVSIPESRKSCESRESRKKNQTPKSRRGLTAKVVKVANAKVAEAVNVKVVG